MAEYNSADEKQFIEKARKRFEASSTDEKPLRDEADKNLAFVAGEQWDANLKGDRTRDGRPSLTFSRCHTFVQQVSNEARQNKLQIKFVPGENGDKDTAEVYEGLARHIQYDSDAQIAYETAAEYSAGGSFGYFRFTTDYADDDTNDLDLKVVPVFDPFSVYGILYPSCFGMEPKFAFVTENIPVDEFKLLYPASIVTSDWEGSLQECGDWVGTETVRIAEYWCVEEEPEEKVIDGEKRTIYKRTVKSVKMTGMEKLPDTETVWPGKIIPIIPVLGKQIIVRGKPRLFSVISFQRDPQQLINFYKTRIAETLATAPVSPWLAAVGQIPREPAMRLAWERAATKTTGVLEYEPVDVKGNPAPPPQRQVFEPPIASLSEAAAQEIDDMKATAGIFDPSLGNKSNEQTGKAIFARQQQASVTNLHIMDNLERAFKKGGTIVADLLPKIYDTPRMVKILGEDESPKIVKINQQWTDSNQKQRHYKVGGDEAGKYDVVVTMGRGYSTKRMESFDMMTQVLQANPNLLPMIGDIFFANSDMAGAQQLADRFKKMLPPNLQDQEGEQIPPEAQQAIAQTKQQLEQMHQYAQLKEQEVQQLTQEKQAKTVEMASREKIAMAEIAAKVTIAEIQTKAQSESERSQMYKEIWSELHGSAHEVAMQSTQQSHEADQAQIAQQAAAEQAQQQEPAPA